VSVQNVHPRPRHSMSSPSTCLLFQHSPNRKPDDVMHCGIYTLTHSVPSPYRITTILKPGKQLRSLGDILDGYQKDVGEPLICYPCIRTVFSAFAVVDRHALRRFQGMSDKTFSIPTGTHIGSKQHIPDFRNSGMA
jgi:hypothetical protein